MMHNKRIWTIAEAADAETLADKLVNYTWCCCNGFELGGYLFLNDSTSADGAQEYGIVKRETMRQIESITFGWCDVAKALSYIMEILSGKYDCENYGSLPDASIDKSANHRCGHCA